MSNSLGSDRDQLSVGPELVENCLKGYMQTTKVAASKEQFNTGGTIFAPEDKSEGFNNVMYLFVYTQCFVYLK